jgi:hypothetical protein
MLRSVSRATLLLNVLSSEMDLAKIGVVINGLGQRILAKFRPLPDESPLKFASAT